MPHIIVKLWPGRPEGLKAELAERIADTVAETMSLDRSVISVALEEVPQDKWESDVYLPDIIKKADTLYIKPGPTSNK